MEYFYLLTYHSLHSLQGCVHKPSSWVEGLSKLKNLQHTCLNDLLTGSLCSPCSLVYQLSYSLIHFSHNELADQFTQYVFVQLVYFDQVANELLSKQLSFQTFKPNWILWSAKIASITFPERCINFCQKLNTVLSKTIKFCKVTGLTYSISHTCAEMAHCLPIQRSKYLLLLSPIFWKVLLATRKRSCLLIIPVFHRLQFTFLYQQENGRNKH